MKILEIVYKGLNDLASGKHRVEYSIENPLKNILKIMLYYLEQV